jgi:hypothetical protein
MKEMTPLEEIRHSAAHVLATAVLRLYPDTQLDIGPPTDSGFYYDFDSDTPFTPEVVEAIEVEMKKVIKENQKFERVEVSREEAVAMIKEMGQERYKTGRLADIPEGEAISFYRNGEFRDLCAGPHVRYTQENQGIQAPPSCRFLSPWRFGKQATPTHLRNRLRKQRRIEPASRKIGGGEKEGSPQHWERSRTFPYRRHGRARACSMETKRSHNPPRTRRFHLFRAQQARILASLHPPCREAGSLQDLWAFPLLSGFAVPPHHSPRQPGRVG